MKTLSFLVAAMMAMPVLADNEVNAPDNSNEFKTEETYEEGFATHYINEAIANGMKNVAQSSEVEYGRKVTDYISAPKFGGYVMGGYWYDNKENNHSGDGFKIKNARMYVSGTILNDFGYLVQVQLTNDKFHMKDYWLEWKKYKEFSVKAGQFIRVFGYENPYNPFEFHEHSYAQITQKLCGQADRVGEDNGGGRDQGIQVQGDLFPVGQDGHRLLHYQVMVSNGQTINAADKNSQKDVSGCIAIQPVAGLRLAFWGWTGNFTGSNGVTVGRNRYMISAFYDKNDWTVRAEYAHSTGGKISDVDNNKAQGWYAAVGIPCSKVVKTWVKYDAYEDNAMVESLKSIYSIAPHIQLHKNLWFLPSFAYVHDRSAASGKRNYCELSAQFGVRF